MSNNIEYIKTLSQAAKDLGFTDLKKFKTEFDDLIIQASGVQMVDQRQIEAHLASITDPMSEKFQGQKKKRPRKQAQDNIGVLRSRIQRREQKIARIQRNVADLEEIYKKSKTDYDQMQYLNIKVELKEAEAGLAKMKDESALLIQSRIKELETESEISKEL
jgi:HPt (histidine-containing phosphotransfer) domain-containing protein